MVLSFQSGAKSFLAFFLLVVSFGMNAQGQTYSENSFVSVSLGGTHGCGFTETGVVKCWGNNQFGQLGVGDTLRYVAQAVTVEGLGVGVTALAAGSEHTCALLANRTVKCWGNNGSYQLGDATNQVRYTPVNVVGLGANVIGITAANNQSCALTDQGVVKCWGYHNLAYKTSPYELSGFGTGITAITAGAHHVCGLTELSVVKCVGSNSHGQIGDGTTTSRSSAVDVIGLGSVSKIRAGGQHTCALTLAGDIYCWGNNTFGQLGDGTQIGRTLPTLVAGGYVFSNLSAAYSNTCGLSMDGSVQCWGANESGQLGNDTKIDNSLAGDVLSLAIGSTQIETGNAFSCAIATSGELNCWGDNSYGKLSDGSTVDRLLPSPINQSNEILPINCISVPFTIGTNVSGYWGQDNDCTAGLRGAGFKTDTFSFWGSAGQLISIEATSSAFNTFLYLRDPLGKMIASDNDGYYNPVSNSTPNSRIPAKWGSFLIPATGTYTIEITSSTTSNPNPSGNYQIVTRVNGMVSLSSQSSRMSSIGSSSSASSIAMSANSSSAISPILSSVSSNSSSRTSSSSASSLNADPCLPTHILMSNSRTDQLSITDCKLGARGSSYYTDRYQISGTAGQRIYIQLTSSAFDTYLYLRNSTGSILTSNDDGGGGTNSRIPAYDGYYTLPSSGYYLIEVTSYGSYKTGAYSLSVISL